MLIVVGIDGLKLPNSTSPFDLPPEQSIAKSLRSLTGRNVYTAVVTNRPLDETEKHFSAATGSGAVNEVRASGGREIRAHGQAFVNADAQAQTQAVTSAYRQLMADAALRGTNAHVQLVGANGLAIEATLPTFGRHVPGDAQSLHSFEAREAFERAAAQHGLDCVQGESGCTLVIPGPFGMDHDMDDLLRRVPRVETVLSFGSTPGDSRMFAAIRAALAGSKKKVDHVSVLARGPETTAEDRRLADFDVSGVEGLEGTLDAVRRLASGELANGHAERELLAHVDVPRVAKRTLGFF